MRAMWLSGDKLMKYVMDVLFTNMIKRIDLSDLVQCAESRPSICSKMHEEKLLQYLMAAELRCKGGRQCVNIAEAWDRIKSGFENQEVPVLVQGLNYIRFQDT
jgi:hypothetical protein